MESSRIRQSARTLVMVVACTVESAMLHVMNFLKSEAGLSQEMKPVKVHDQTSFVFSISSI